MLIPGAIKGGDGKLLPLAAAGGQTLPPSAGMSTSNLRAMCQFLIAGPSTSD
jgi:hypothetical protein